MQNFSDLGIPLRAVRFSERDKIITLLTHHHGKISVLAKNSVHSKRFGSTLEHFHASEFEWRDFSNSRKLAILSSATLRKSFTHFPLQWPLHLAGASITETLLQIAPENAPCPELFALYSHALLGLELVSDSLTKKQAEGTHPADEALLAATALGKWIHFHLKLLNKLGHGLQLTTCILCENSTFLDTEKDQSYTSLLLNPLGWVCSFCKNNRLLKHDLSLRQELPTASLRWLYLLESINLSEELPALVFAQNDESAQSAAFTQQLDTQENVPVDKRKILALLCPVFQFLEKALLVQMSSFSSDAPRARALSEFKKWIEQEKNSKSCPNNQQLQPDDLKP